MSTSVTRSQSISQPALQNHNQDKNKISHVSSIGANDNRVPATISTLTPTAREGQFAIMSENVDSALTTAPPLSKMRGQWCKTSGQPPFSPLPALCCLSIYAVWLLGCWGLLSSRLSLRGGGRFLHDLSDRGLTVPSLLCRIRGRLLHR